jgi:broad specificity phosphatase PhoE
MELILGRHGNTFEANQTPKWVGSKNDLPLSKTGIEQAETLALYLKKNSIKLDAIYCGPLQRTKIYAEIILDKISPNLILIVDNRLNEIDYGTWSGLTTAEVQERFGTKELELWEKYSNWPTTGNWKPSEKIAETEAISFANDLIKKYPANSKILAISSNGRLRYFLKLITNEFALRIKNQTIKTATGNISKLIYKNSNNKWNLEFWNLRP